MSTIVSKLNHHIENSKFNIFAIIVINLLVSSCIAGIATMAILENNADTWQLVTCAMLASLSNCMAIAQAPMKWIFGSFVASVVVNLVLIFINII